MPVSTHHPLRFATLSYRYSRSCGATDGRRYLYSRFLFHDISIIICCHSRSSFCSSRPLFQCVTDMAWTSQPAASLCWGVGEGINTRALNVSDRPVSTLADSGTCGAPHSPLAAASLPPPPPQVSENLVSPFASRNRQSLRGVWEMLSYGTHAVCETSTCFGWRGFKGAATLSSRSDDVVSFSLPSLVSLSALFRKGCA